MTWPTELRVNPDKDALAILFDDGARASLTAERLRTQSPSAEVQGHGGKRAGDFGFWIGQHSPSLSHLDCSAHLYLPLTNQP